MPDDKNIIEYEPTEIVPVEQAVNQLQGRPLTVRTVRALQVISEGKVPPNAIEKRPGKGGKTFSYVKHTWITQLLNDAFGQLWSFKGGEHVIISENDGSIAASGRLILKYPVTQPDGKVEWFEREIMEYGAIDGAVADGKSAWNGSPNYAMSQGDRILSAISLALTRCAMRAFNIGMEFRDSSDKGEMSLTDAWTTLIKTGKKLGLSDQEVLAACKEAGISKENLVTDFETAYWAVYNASKRKESVPADL